MVITVIIIVYTLILYTHTALLAHTLHTYIHCIIYRPIICLHPTHFAYPNDTHISITLYTHYQHIIHSLVAPFHFFHKLPSYLDRYQQQLHCRLHTGACAALVLAPLDVKDTLISRSTTKHITFTLIMM